LASIVGATGRRLSRDHKSASHSVKKSALDRPSGVETSESEREYAAIADARGIGPRAAWHCPAQSRGNRRDADDLRRL